MTILLQENVNNTKENCIDFMTVTERLVQHTSITT